MTLEQRLEKLERENRWMRRIGAVGLALVVVSLALSICALASERDGGPLVQESRAAREARAAAEALAEHREPEAKALTRVAGLQCERHLESAELWHVITGKYPRSMQVMDFDFQAGNKESKGFTIASHSPELTEWIASHSPELTEWIDSRLFFIEVEPDPWGNPYVLEVSANEMSVRSFGPDGRKDTEDDIVVSVSEEGD